MPEPSPAPSNRSPTRLNTVHICCVLMMPFSSSSSVNLVRHAALCVGSRSCAPENTNC